MLRILIFFVLVCSACELRKETKTPLSYSFWVGTYTHEGSEGIYEYVLQEDGVLKSEGLVARSENPSFLALSKDKKYLLAVNEVNRERTGTVESYAVGEDSLTFISRSASGGADPCFVSVHENGFVLTANYTGGNVGLLRLNEKGVLTGLLDVQQHVGKGTTERQEGPHAHSAWFVQDGQQVIAVDLGTNALWFSNLDTVKQKLVPAAMPVLSMKPGAGPRHLACHPNRRWIYVVNELDCTVTLVNKSAEGVYTQGASVSTLPEGYTAANTCADIHLSSDGKFLYVSNRGHNSIACYRIDAQHGILTLLGHEYTQGDGPRNFALSPDDQYVLVANQRSHNIVSFKRDQTTGKLHYLNQVRAFTPVCILFQ